MQLSFDLFGAPPKEESQARPPACETEAENILPLPPPKRQRVHALKARIARFERLSSSGTISFGDPRVDGCFPHGGLARAAWHEIGGAGMERETPAAAAGFAAALARRAAPRGAILWVMQRDDLYAPGLGLDPDRLIFVKAEKDEGVLSVMESAARTSGVAAIIGEVSSVSLTAGRRLQLACEHHGAIAFALRRRFSAPLRERAEKHSTETTRWRIAPAPSDTSLPGLGPPRWEVHLERSRNGRPGAWIMEAYNAADEKESPKAGPKTGPKTGIVTVVAELADHTAETRARRQPPGWAAGSRDHDPGRQYAAPGRG